MRFGRWWSVLLAHIIFYFWTLPFFFYEQEHGRHVDGTCDFSLSWFKSNLHSSLILLFLIFWYFTIWKCLYDVGFLASWVFYVRYLLFFSKLTQLIIFVVVLFVNSTFWLLSPFFFFSFLMVIYVVDSLFGFARLSSAPANIPRAASPTTVEVWSSLGLLWLISIAEIYFA